MASVAWVNKEFVLEQLRTGRILAEIAPALGVSKSAVSDALKNDPDYQAALKVQVSAMIDECKIMTWAAREALDIARARECARFAFRYAEAIDPERWSPQSRVTITHNDDLGDRLRRAQLREREIQGERIDAGGPKTLAAPAQDDALTNGDSGIGGTGDPPRAPSNSHRNEP